MAQMTFMYLVCISPGQKYFKQIHFCSIFLDMNIRGCETGFLRWVSYMEKSRHKNIFTVEHQYEITFLKITLIKNTLAKW